jgi:hypothetical protein
MFHLLAYTGNFVAPQTNADLTAVTDPEFSQRNGHFILTEKYKMLNTIALSTALSSASVICPSWNAIGRMNVNPFLAGATWPNIVATDLRLGFEAALPLNEEIQYQVSLTGVAAQQAFGLIYVGTQQHSNKLPMPAPPGFNMIVKATISITTVANAWTGPVPLTFEQSLRGGVYSVVGADVEFPTTIAYRVVFPRNPLYNGRRLRPGGITFPALGVYIPQYGIPQARIWGEFGRFHTFEPPQIEILSTASAAIAPVVYLHLVYLGDYDDPLQGFTAA